MGLSKMNESQQITHYRLRITDYALPITHYRTDTMTLWIPKNRKQLKQHLNDPLFKNAYFLMLSSVTSAGSGIKL